MICENISSKESYRDDPLLVAVLSATVNEEEMDVDDLEELEPEKEAEQRSRKDKFLFSSLNSKIDQQDEMQQKRLSHIKNQVLEKIKVQKLSRRSLSNKRRGSFLGTEDPGRSRSRPRTSSPPSALPQ